MASTHPIPTALKIARNNPGHQTLNKNEPQPDTSDLTLPSELNLSDNAKKQWKIISKHLKNSGLLTVIDRPALAMYCEACARWVHANKELQKNGMVIIAQSGFPVQSPYLSISNKAFDQMKSLMVEFGMTPSSRSKVSATPIKIKAKENPYNSL